MLLYYNNVRQRTASENPTDELISRWFFADSCYIIVTYGGTIAKAWIMLLIP